MSAFNKSLSSMQRVRQLARPLLALMLTLFMVAQTAEARVIAVIKSDDLAAYAAPVESFSRGVNGRVVVYDLGGDLEKGRQIAEQLSQVPPDLIFALGAKAAYTARKYVTNVPIIFAMVINPEKYQLAQPNVTGITLEVPPETAFTQFRMFVPEISKVGVLYSPATEEIVKRAEKAIAGLGITLVKAQVADSSEVPEAFERIKNSVDCLWQVPDAKVYKDETLSYLLKKTRAGKLPFLAYSTEFVKSGALLAVSPSYETLGSQAAAIAKQILDDKVAPAAIPLAPPIGTHVTVNVDTARALELKIDPLVLAFADEVIGAAPASGEASVKTK